MSALRFFVAMTLTLAAILAMFGTMLVISAVPGPSDFAVVARSLSSGLGQALGMIVGIIAADVVFILLAMFGLTAIAETMDEWFVLLKFLGAGFLIWLGIAAILPLLNGAGRSPDQSSIPVRHSKGSSFIAGFLITLGDPKAILFYFGLLPAYLDPERASLLDTVLVVLTATVAIIVVKVTYAFLADRARLVFDSPKIRIGMTAAAGLIMLATGIVLIFQNWTE